MKRGTFSDHAFGPDLAAMKSDDAMYDSQTNASSLEVADAMQTLEHAKQLGVITHIETSAVIFDGID